MPHMPVIPAVKAAISVVFRMLYQSFSTSPARPAGWFRMSPRNLSTSGVKIALSTAVSALLQDLREVSVEHGSSPIEASLAGGLAAELAQMIGQYGAGGV